MLQLIRKDPASGDTNCPSLYADPDDPANLFVVGTIVNDGRASQIAHLKPNEVLVSVPSVVLYPHGGTGV